MAENKDVWVNAARFNENAHKVPAEEILKYAAQHIAWSLDGTSILASAADEVHLDEKLKMMGIDPSQVVFDYLPPYDSVLL